MAGKKKKAQPMRRRIVKYALRTLAAVLAALLIWMYLQANVVRLKFATLPLRDLPSAFEGTKVLFISDLQINSLNSVDKINALMDELMRLSPDLLLLGGDYTSFDPLMRMQAVGGGNEGAYAVETDLRDLFFLHLAKFNPTLGKFGVAGEDDNLLERNAGTSLADAMALGGVTLLRDQAARVYKGNECLTIIGVDDWRTGMQDVRTPSQLATAGECVLLLCHNPEAIATLNNYPAADGRWIDAALSGHVHSGMAGLNLLNRPAQNDSLQVGWHIEDGAKVLISGGVGNNLLPLRLSVQPEAHLITLTGVAE